MVGGAMFPQCFPRRSADSLSPSRISMKSYLGEDGAKGHIREKITLKRRKGPLSHSSSYDRHSFLDTHEFQIDKPRSPMLLVDRQNRYRKLHQFTKATQGNEHPGGRLDFNALSLAYIRAIAFFLSNISKTNNKQKKPPKPCSFLP